MKTQIYPEQKKFSKFDDKHYIVYLNEEPAQYLPSVSNTGQEMPEENIESVPGYSYSGPMEDGGTLITASEASYPDFVSGLIRLKYSTDAESAIQANMITALTDPENPRASEFRTEWDTFQAYREKCKEISRLLLQ